MFNVFWRTIKDKKWTILVYCLAVIIFLWMYIALFPSFQKAVGTLNQYLKSFPQSFLKAFGIEANSFTTFEGYISSEQYSFVWSILLIALVVSMANSFLAGETEKGTIGILLSQPISRIKIFLEKFSVGIINLILFVAASILSVFPLAKAYNIVYKSEGFFKLALIGFMFGLAVFGLSMLFSAIFSEKSKVNFMIVGTLLVMYFINIIAGLKTSLDKLKYFSFFYYFKPPDILVYNKISHWTLLVFLGTFFITSALALIWFKKRDVAI